MKVKKTTVFLFVVILALTINASAMRAQYKSYNGGDNNVSGEQNKADIGRIEKETSAKFYIIESSRWPKIQFFGVYSAMVVWISFILGLSIFLIARFAGAKESKVRIWASILTAVFIGILSRSLNIMIRDGIFWLFDTFLDPVAASSIADFLSYALWLIFTAGVAVHFYEIITVTAKEVFQNR